MVDYNAKRGLRWHNLPRTCASLAVAPNLYIVMNRLGHDGIKTTINTYGHLLPSVDAALADGLASLFEADKPRRVAALVTAGRCGGCRFALMSQRPKPGDRVRVPHPDFVGAGQEEEAEYVRDAPDHVVPMTLAGASERIPQGVVRYDDGRERTWTLDAIASAADR